MSPAKLRLIREHAARSYPEEACGGLLGHASRAGIITVAAVTPLPNDETEPTRRYRIGPWAVRELERRAEMSGLAVVGFYHSHPDTPAVPSEADREHAWPWYVYLIIGTAEGGAGQCRAWRLSEDRRRFRRLSIDTGDRCVANRV